ncbi:hypothetical protein [Laceyella sacchari]|uniref:CBM-cenC domain-containing protein n=1 Tax=Laceyella sacchari TaxID=37482 RepID=A0ABY5U6P4_LACSH|nr:hypothetical protein [Laceyella sacchari]KPC73953.1 hypothetical protein ADL26_13040 [Thermoactinomyces vulgaris]UWE04295.1 hypothetical protein NYR52_03820 [Laceyella sacchari]
MKKNNRRHQQDPSSDKKFDTIALFTKLDTSKKTPPSPQHTPESTSTRSYKFWILLTGGLILFALLAVGGYLFFLAPNTQTKPTTMGEKPPVSKEKTTEESNRSTEPPLRQNLVQNPSFENDLQGWRRWAPDGQNHVTSIVKDFPHTGKKDLNYWSDKPYKQRIYQKLDNLPNGVYEAKIWLRSGGGQRHLEFGVRSYDRKEKGEKASIDLKNKAIPDVWTEFTVPDIKVTSGTATVFIYSEAKAENWADFDDVQFYRIK